MQNAKLILSKMVGQSPRGVALLFNKYGIKAPVNEDTLLAALVRYKEPFVNDLYKVVIDGFSNVEGPPTYEQWQDETKNKGTFFNILNGVVGALTGVNQALGTVKSITTPSAATSSAPEEPEKTMGMPTAFWIGLGLVAILIVILIVLRKK